MEVRKPKNPIKFYIVSLQKLLKARVSYRADFFIMLAAVFIKEFAQIALLLVIVERFEALAGWNKWQIAFLYCMISLVYRLFYSFFGNISTISELTISGRLDMYLIYPRKPLLMLISKAYIWRIFYNFAIFALLIFVYIKAGGDVSVIGFIVLILSVMCSVIIIFSIYLIIGTLSFYLTNVRSVLEIIGELIGEYMKYPLNIFGKAIGLIFTFIFPIGFIAYYPSIYLLNIENSIYFSSYTEIITPLLSVILLVVALLFWRKGLKKYNSTGT
ncbi:MAG: ABC-2 family transporter protein [Clostridia bacterium]|nr:ABC-2 family transporter protein [Clostridia bacterium]MBN2884081.1 ABC-2 family transporter protein [Clostridia bacterium]